MGTQGRIRAFMASRFGDGVVQTTARSAISELADGRAVRPVEVEPFHGLEQSRSESVTRLAGGPIDDTP